MGHLPDTASQVFAALGDPTRLSLVERLAREGPASLVKLAESLPMSRQAVSRHLQVLADAGLLEGRREGRETVWAYAPSGIDAARAALDAIGAGWDAALARLKAHVEG